MTETRELTPLDELREQIEGVLQNVGTLEIKTQEQYIASQELLRQLARYRKDVEAERKKEVAPLNEQVKAVNARYKEADAIAETADLRLRTVGLNYRREQERIATEHQAKLLEQQRKEEERLKRRAGLARKKGQVEKAEALFAQAETVPVAVVAPATPKVEGISDVTVWEWEVADEAKIPREYWQLDTKAIGAVVRSLHKRAEQTIPGIRVLGTKTTRVS